MAGFADRVLEALGPALRTRAGELLPDLVDALVGPLEDLDTLSRPPAHDRPWAAWFDLDHTTQPSWIGSVTGTTIPGGLTLEQQRAYVRDRAAWRRGRLDAVAAAVRALLTGDQRVAINERVDDDGDPDAWQLVIHVYDDETTATGAEIAAAAAAQKPVGIRIADIVLHPAGDEPPGITWWRPPGHRLTFARVRAEYATFADLTAGFGSFAELRDHDPTPEEI